MIPTLEPDTISAFNEILALQMKQSNIQTSQDIINEIFNLVQKLQHPLVQTLIDREWSSGKALKVGEEEIPWETAFLGLQKKFIVAWVVAKEAVQSATSTQEDVEERLWNLKETLGNRGLLSDRDIGGLRDLKFHIQRIAQNEANESVFALLTGTSLASQKPERSFVSYEEEWVQKNQDRYVATKIGCNNFLTIFANVDKIQAQIPAYIRVEGTQVPIRVLRKEGFLVLRAKLTPVLQQFQIGQFALNSTWSESAFLLVICTETPFNIAGYKFIEKAPSDPWDITGGLENVSKKIGSPVAGVGQRLIFASLQLAKAYSIKTVTIQTVKEAHGFYVKMGFVGEPGTQMTFAIPYMQLTSTRSIPV